MQLAGTGVNATPIVDCAESLSQKKARKPPIRQLPADRLAVRGAETHE